MGQIRNCALLLHPSCNFSLKNFQIHQVDRKVVINHISAMTGCLSSSIQRQMPNTFLVIYPFYMVPQCIFGGQQMTGFYLTLSVSSPLCLHKEQKLHQLKCLFLACAITPVKAWSPGTALHIFPPCDCPMTIKILLSELPTRLCQWQLVKILSYMTWEHSGTIKVKL